MEFSNRHNLSTLPPSPAELRFGIRVSLPSGDPFRRLLGADWRKEQWFATRRERDEALGNMGKRHAFSRIGDTPSIVLEPIER